MLNKSGGQIAEIQAPLLVNCFHFCNKNTMKLSIITLSQFSIVQIDDSCLNHNRWSIICSRYSCFSCYPNHVFKCETKPVLFFRYRSNIICRGLRSANVIQMMWATRILHVQANGDWSSMFSAQLWHFTCCFLVHGIGIQGGSKK